MDGGYILRRVVWICPSNYHQICLQYVAYITKHYGQSVTVVFDGYSSPSTKDEEHSRRTGKVSAETVVDDCLPAFLSQGVFMTNKVRFINLLSSHLQSTGIDVIHAPADADSLIVSTSLDLARTGKISVIVGEDNTDLLVLLISLSDESTDVRMLIPGKKGANHKIYSSVKLRANLGDLCTTLLFFHAATGCDTASTPFRKGKKGAFRKFRGMTHSEKKSKCLTKRTLHTKKSHQQGNVFF